MNPYRAFPNSNLIQEWGKLLKLSREEVVELHNTWIDIDKYNTALSKEMFEAKWAKLQEVEAFMELNNIDIWNYKKRGIITEKKGYKGWFKSNVADKIAEKYPHYGSHIPAAHQASIEVDGIMLSNNQSPTTIVELYDKIKREYSSRLKEVKLKDRLLIASVRYAYANNIDTEGFTPKDVINVVDEHAKDEYRKQNLPDGTEIYLKHGCDECSAHTVGDHRCSCGNRRVMMVVEGNLIDGYEHYPEAY